MDKQYTVEQLRDAEKLAKILANIQPKHRSLTVMMTNSFVAGMEAQKAIDEATVASQGQAVGEYP